MRLVNEKTGEVIRSGEKVTSFRGETATVSDPVGSPPTHEGSGGRIYVKENGDVREYFPSVFYCKWVEEKEPWSIGDIHQAHSYKIFKFMKLWYLEVYDADGDVRYTAHSDKLTTLTDFLATVTVA